MGKGFLKFVIGVAAVGVAAKAGMTAVAKKKSELKEKNETSDVKEYFNVVGGEDIKVEGKVASDMKIRNYVGGVNIDLSKAIFEKDITIELQTAVGGVNLVVPENINVEVKYEAKMSGTNNLVKYHEGAKTIYLCGKVTAGGVNIQIADEETCGCSEDDIVEDAPYQEAKSSEESSDESQIRSEEMCCE